MKIVIKTSGGAIQSVHSDVANTEVEIYDSDDWDDDDEEENEQEYEDAVNGMIEVW